MASNSSITFSDDFIITGKGTIKEPTKSLGSTMFEQMLAHQDDIAQIDARTGHKDTFGTFLQRCVRTALHMADRNITRDHVITLCTNNHLNSAVPFIATQFLGAKVGSIDPSFSVEEMKHLLNTVRPKIIFSIPESIPDIEKALEDIHLKPEIVVYGKTEKHTEFEDFVKQHDGEKDFKPAEIQNLKDTAIIYFSSGTTGLPKGICLSHYGFVGHNINTVIVDMDNLEELDQELLQGLTGLMSFPITHLSYTSAYWVSAGSVLLSSINEGFCRLLSDFDGRGIWTLIQKYKPMVLMLTPFQVMEMLPHRPPETDVSSVLSVVIIGSSIAKTYMLQLQAAFPRSDVNTGYGQTETNGPVLLFKPLNKRHNELRQNQGKLESVGLPLKGISYKIVDTETGKNLGPNEQGELRIKSRFLMNGYHNVDSSDTFDQDGWLKTGDIAYYDTDFCFYIVDRIKEAFKYRGWFIAPASLETELMKHPAVKVAVVVGIPHDDGHHPMGLVVVNEGHRVTEDEIEKFVEERVSERQRLRAGVKFIKDVPVTATGKVKRKELRDKVLAGKL